MTVLPAEVLNFWVEAGPEKWFEKDAGFDADIKARFAKLHDEAASGALDHWTDTAEGALALILVLDQFSRNLFRNDSRAFAQDAHGLRIADEAIARGHDRAFDLPLRRFFYMPFMHSEDLADQQRCIDLCAACGDEEGVKYGKIHADIIRDFGRFPHRNDVLGRDTKPAEQKFLDDGGFAG